MGGSITTVTKHKHKLTSYKERSGIENCEE